MVDWSGALSNVSFQVITPKYATSKTVHGSCGISVDGLTIGQMHFELQLSNGDHSHPRQISRAAGSNLLSRPTPTEIGGAC